MSELFDKLKEYADSDHLPMHMPGHKRRMGELGNPFFIDITEIEGFDNLHHAEGILQSAQERAARLYGSEETHYLINGSTGGILAAISGCTSFGGTILMARNSHKAAYHAALLKGLHIHYIYPQSMEEMGINGAVSPEEVEKILKKHPEIQAVFVTSPTYDGVVSDVRRIAEIVHQQGIPLIVDGAHGAHFPFSEHFPEDAVRCGADVVINSIHKTLPSLTQTALIHLNGELADRNSIRRYLSIYQSSSPSYVLMASLDECMGWIDENRREFECFWERLQRLRKDLRTMKRLKLLEIAGMDESKILVSVKGTSLNGNELACRLREEYHIELEMACSTYVCAITTVADTEESLKRFSEAFLAMDCSLSESKEKKRSCEKKDTTVPAYSIYTIRQASEIPSESCILEEAEGRISGDFITLYPPGIPLLAPGERVSRDMVGQIYQYLEAGFEVHGVRNREINVLKREK